ncbi:hypothetical protein DUNSADRAFT_3754 [Dunaliella salina]|uniref:Uncharacterized protein n=1 Tax=Dunaliella salina TaxID=3046 RepID=A0ABQ7GTD5_DUNSA|nr:hypothetical protein DUNSADRAFT_3754 [Dunaliella salina]|eukprot:KAF5837861.1 hypothetical protein DUNSADRAFT_3754 [Dunaliella salina]
MSAVDSFAEQQQQSVVTRAKPVQRFLKRGEGTQKRIFGPQLLKAKQQTGVVNSFGQQAKAPAPSQAPHAPARTEALSHAAIAATQLQPTLEQLDELAELQAETTLVELEEAQRQEAKSGERQALY